MNIIGMHGFAQSGKDTAGKHLTDLHGFTRYAFADRIREIAIALDYRVNGDVSVKELLERCDHDWKRALAHRVYGPELRRAIEVFNKHLAQETFQDTDRSQEDLQDDLLVLDPFLNGDVTMAALLEQLNGDWEAAKNHRLYGFEVRRFLQILGTDVVRVNYGGTAWVDVVKRQIEAEKPENVVITDVRFLEEAEWVLATGGRVVEVTRPGVKAVNGHVSEKRLPEQLISVTVSNNNTLEALGLVLDRLAKPAPASSLAA